MDYDRVQGMTTYYFDESKPEVYKNAIQHINSLNNTKEWVVTIEQRKPDSKTAQQRKYFHMLLSLFCKETGNDMCDMKMAIKYRVCPLKEVTIDGETHMYPVSSEDLTIGEYGDLIEAAQILCVSHGINYPDPRDLGMRF